MHTCCLDRGVATIYARAYLKNLKKNFYYYFIYLFIGLFYLFIDFLHSKRPRFQNFSRNSRLRLSQVTPLPQVNSLSTYSKAFSTVFKIALKTQKNTMLVHRTLDHTSHQFYPGIYVALVTLPTYPVSGCAAERSFSGMKRLKTPL